MREKLTLLLLVATFCTLGFAQNGNPPDVLITVQKKNTTIGEILQEIEKQSGQYFVFSKADLDTKQKIDWQVQNEKLETALKNLFAPLHITFVFSGNHIILKQQIVVAETKPKEVKQPDRIRKVRAATDKEVKAIDDIAINEVVVVGYGYQKRQDIIGSVASVSGLKLSLSQRPNLTNALSGNLLGVRTIQRSGRPGYDESQIDIRGYGDEILVIVDGVERSFSQIDPNEIESISVLKDVSAVVYGARGANGVLLITTKKGSDNQPKITYNFNYALQSITRYPEYTNVWDYMEYYNEASLNLSHLGQKTLFSTEDMARAENTDWKGAVLKNVALMQHHNVNVAGGNKDTKYFFSLAYLNQDGILKTRDNFHRFNFRSNISTTISDNLTADMQLGGRKEVRDAPATISGGGSLDNFSQGIFKNLAMALPYQPIYANHNPAYYNNLGSEPNPVALLDRNLVGTDRKENEELDSKFSLNYVLPQVKGLSLKASIAYDRQIETQKIFKKSASEYTYYPITEQYVAAPLIQTTGKSETLSQNDILTQQYSIRYNNCFEQHDLSGLLVWEIREFNHSQNLASGEFGISTVPELDAAEANNKNIGGNSYKTASMGIVGRINYIYDNRYLLELSFREDGVSKFLKNDRWVFTPGISAGWRISEEKFMKDRTQLFDNLKLRASYGVFSLAPNLQEYYFLTGYNYPGTDIFGGTIYFMQGENNPVVAATDRGIINPNLTWEKVTITNIGLDATLWKEKLYTEMDVFYRSHTGMYATRSQTLPTTFGATLPDENLNSESDRGVEIVIGSKQRFNELLLDFKGSFSYTRKKMEYRELPEAGNQYAYWASQNAYRWNNISWGYEAKGQFQNFAEILQAPIQDGEGNTTLLPGDIKYKDLNKDGIINDLDLTPIGRNDRPELFFGFNLMVLWKNFDLTLLLQGASHYTYTFNYKDSFVQGGMGNAYEMYKDRWHRADVNDPNSEWISGRFPPLRVESYAGNQANSTFWSKNASYLRLKTIDLGYTLPTEWTTKAGIRKIRIYTSAYNLLTFTLKDLKYVDPEGESGYGMYYPQMKTVNFGVNVEF
jgi:TonB-linked SusC/RagA family outer membrane protein